MKHNNQEKQHYGQDPQYRYFDQRLELRVVENDKPRKDPTEIKIRKTWNELGWFEKVKRILRLK